MKPKLRDGKKLNADIYPINEIPKEMVVDIGGHIVFQSFTGRKDISGDDWGNIFADVIGGEHLASPVGIADVVMGKMAWSMKTVKAINPHTAKNVRLISGRCSPDYSFGIEDPHKDIQKTGEAVLSIWNARVDIALCNYGRTRVNVLVRSNDLSTFTLFEEYMDQYNLADYEWIENDRNNFEGIHRKTGTKQFVWQPHGSQFTICTEVPQNAIKFKVKHPESLDVKSTLEKIGFDPSWVTIY